MRGLLLKPVVRNRQVVVKAAGSLTGFTCAPPVLRSSKSEGGKGY